MLCHYEIVLLLNSEQTVKIEEFKTWFTQFVKNNRGLVDRSEDWGRIGMKYMIKKVSKAHYLLFNITLPNEMVSELRQNLKHHTLVLRDLILKVDQPFKEKSSFALKKDKDQKLPTPFILKDHVNYKNIPLLKNFVIDTGKLIPARISGVSMKNQRKISHHVKLARFLALLPYCDKHDL